MNCQTTSTRESLVLTAPGQGHGRRATAHESSSAASRTLRRPADRAARLWSAFIALDVTAALAIQLALILSGEADPKTGDTVASVGVATRLVQTLSYFTIQSNLLVLVVAVTLVLNP